MTRLRLRSSTNSTPTGNRNIWLNRHVFAPTRIRKIGSGWSAREGGEMPALPFDGGDGGTDLQGHLFPDPGQPPEQAGKCRTFCLRTAQSTARPPSPLRRVGLSLLILLPNGKPRVNPAC